MPGATLARLDTVFAVETPEGITLALRPAGLVARGLAYAIDLAIRMAIFTAVLIASQLVGKVGWALVLLVYFALEWFYPVVFELTRAAATPGQRSLGLRVVMDSGLPVTPAASITRNLLRAADFMPMFYGAAVLSMLWRRDSKRLGDLAAGTLVVFADSVSLHGKLPSAAPLAPARQLSAPEQVAIMAWAGRANRLTPERFDELAAIATPVLAAGAAGTPSERLLGVAHWLLGHRNRDTRP